ncbi:hypothetical protein Hypma_012597 [Hypsizygus marmoreus]|uniref:DUF6534 domain-containing protein n=1 Tax=Hypsizygus marmoreus TaxID=39966 RepID=A0A369JG40_HYPMA|nr:hypothetical protein Hypma_012597 [Hypsizygus marmoreus]
MNIIGIYLVATWVNMLLYSLELTLVFLYFHKFKKDRKYLRVLVLVMLVVDSAGTICGCVATWKHAVTLANMPLLWIVAVLGITRSITAVLEQTFLTYRFYILSRSKIISGFFIFLALLHLSFAMTSCIHLMRFPAQLGPNISISKTVTTVAICISTTLDTLLPIALIWQLQKYSSHFRTTQSLIRRISIQAVSSGSVVALLGITFVILVRLLFLEFLLISLIFGRVYTITVLANLLSRKSRSSLSISRLHTSSDYDLSRDINFEVLAESRPRPESIIADIQRPPLSATPRSSASSGISTIRIDKNDSSVTDAA